MDIISQFKGHRSLMASLYTHIVLICLIFQEWLQGEIDYLYSQLYISMKNKTFSMLNHLGLCFFDLTTQLYCQFGEVKSKYEKIN